MEVAVPGSTYGRPLLCLYIDDQLIDQLGAEGITITDASSVRVATVFPFLLLSHMSRRADALQENMCGEGSQNSALYMSLFIICVP